MLHVIMPFILFLLYDSLQGGHTRGLGGGCQLLVDVRLVAMLCMFALSANVGNLMWWSSMNELSAYCLLQSDGHSSRKDMSTMLDALINALHGGWKGGDGVARGGGRGKGNSISPLVHR